MPSSTEASLYEEETEKQAYARLIKRIYHEMVPERQKYDAEMQEVQDAYEGMLRMSRDSSNLASKVFPIVFMLVDAKLSVVLAARPRAVFEHTVERSKVPFIEMLYDHFTTDADDGVDLEVVDYIWHWYNELYGWSIKRIWHEVDQWVEYDEQVETEMDMETGEEKIVYNADGFANIKYSRCLRRKSKVRQRVYKPDMVAVDPDAMFLYEAQDIAFFEDMGYDEWSVKFQDNPRFKHTEKVHPGKYMAPNGEALFMAQDSDGNLALYNAKTNLGRDKVRVVEYYNLARDEYAVFFNGILALHVPNPTPPVDGRKVLPAADLHNRLRPGTFYSRSEGKVVEPIVVMWQRMLNAKTRRAELAASPVVLTDTPSGLAPKSFKVMPGAHWKGMKGRAEVLNLAGVDTGELREYIELLRDQAKVTTGVDFDRFIAEPDPTAQQQMAREAASQLRTGKDVRLQETLGHVRSMKITLATLQKYIPVPEIAEIAQASDEEKELIKSYDKIDEHTYYKYAKIPLKDKFFIDETYEEGTGKLNMTMTKKRTKSANDFFFARPEFLRTKSPIKVRAVSDRKQSQSRALRLEIAREILAQAFGLPPKNDWEIQNAIAKQEPPPKPQFYINRPKAVERLIDAGGEDVKELTEPEDQYRGRPAMKLMQEIFKGKPPTLLPDEQQKQGIDQAVAMSATKTQPSPVDLASAQTPGAPVQQSPKVLPQVVEAVAQQ
ncbi:hypothetical protein KW797_00095 [Candidatus Parcubacteria bacterium]|nr:hypothetical protein [Candidatus Parcubacteria bacterium]